jgi:hypothetical protein
MPVSSDRTEGEVEHDLVEGAEAEAVDEFSVVGHGEMIPIG